MQAKQLFKHALALCADSLSTTCEAVMLNLAHSYRKLQKYAKSIALYQRCLQLNPRCPLTFSALGLAYYLNKSVLEAVECYNKALFLKPNDQFTNDLLYIALFECGEVTMDDS